MIKNKPKHIHFVGIGGIGMSGIAQVLAQKGYHVSGCDTDCAQKSVSLLRALGCEVSEKHNSELCQDDSIDLLVYSTSINKNNPEFSRAQDRNIQMVHRSEMLAYLMSMHTYNIGITGSHGKTTTSSLVSHIFLKALYEPTVVIGGILSTISSNAKAGKSGPGNILIAEADESDRSLLNLPVTHAILTSITPEHLNVFKDLADIQHTFFTFLSNLPAHGKAIVCLDDKNIQAIITNLSLQPITYGLNENADWQIVDYTLNPSSSDFIVYHQGNFYGAFTVALAGLHNIQNATAALALAHEFKIPLQVTQESLANFAGVDRRFTFKGLTHKGAEIFDDYGHHPVELACTFKVARVRAQKRLVVLFQFHRYTRTKFLWQDFINVFSENLLNHLVDELILTDVYPASEEPLEGINTQTFIADLLKKFPATKISYLPIDHNFKSMTTYLDSILKEGDLLLIQGAGTLNKIADKLTR